MKSLKSHLIFSRSERDGILSLLVLIIILISVILFVDFSEEEVLDISSDEVVAFQRRVDSLKQIRQLEVKQVEFPFNPNFITDFKAYTLGMNPEEYDRLRKFREAGKWINSAEDFKTITGIPDSLLEAIRPLFKFPEWTTRRTSKNTSDNYAIEQLSTSQKQDLNTATKNDLEKVFGIGPVLSERIIEFRERLGGFSSEVQLQAVYGLQPYVIDRISERFMVRTPVQLKKIDINTATASDLATIPGISFEQAKEIWEFRILREHISDLSELSKIAWLTEQKLGLITLYLSTE